AIYDSYVNAVSDGVGALDGFPGVKLRGAEFRFFMRMPSNAGRIENDLSSTESRHTRAFRIPLVPANLHADFAVFRFKIRKTKIAGSEIKLFVVERVVGDVHLSVFPEEAAVCIENRTGIVIDAGGTTFKQRND